jgi:hypothetical protein
LLLCSLQSLKRIANASTDDLGQLPGFAALKAKRVRDVFSQPFRVGETRTGRERREERQRLQDGVGGGKGTAASESSSSSVSRGRFIQDEEDQQIMQELEAEAASQKAKSQNTLDSDPATFVKPKHSSVATSNVVEVNDDEEVENAGEKTE